MILYEFFKYGHKVCEFSADGGAPLLPRVGEFVVLPSRIFVGQQLVKEVTWFYGQPKAMAIMGDAQMAWCLPVTVKILLVDAQV